MPLPSLNDYTESLQNPHLALSDPLLKKCQVKSNMLGLPIAICGGLALTFTLENNSGQKFAVRCFHKDAPERARRYEAITKRLKELRSPYFVDFEYQPRGISIKGPAYPIVKMAWATGETLGQFVENNLRDAQKLENLRKALVNLAAFLQSAHIAHGDIQPGNLMVSDSGRKVQLIDYDGMFVEPLRHIGASEAGLRNFQHPDRSRLNPWNDRLDRFSFIVLDLALRALEHDPSLWKSTQSDDEKFLFSANDFADPDHSALFAQVEAFPNLAAPITNLRHICKASLDNVPSLTDFFSLSPASSTTVRIGTRPRQPQAYLANYPVLKATDYATFEKHVGEKVELIGYVTECKHGYTKNGDDYVFINFGDWKGKIVKLTAWSEGVEDIGIDPLLALKDEWVSFTGMIEAPYHNKKLGYTHISLTIHPGSLPHIITEKEANFRLTPQSQSKPVVNTATGEGSFSPKRRPATTAPRPKRNTSNTDLLNQITGKRHGANTTAPTAPTPSKPAVPAVPSHNPPSPTNKPGTNTYTPAPSSTDKSTNQDILKNLATIRGGSIQLASSPQPNPPLSSPKEKPPPSSDTGCLLWMILALIFVSFIVLTL